MSSIFSILNAGGSGTPAARQVQAPGPSGIAFENFLLAAQGGAEPSPPAASGASSEAQESVTPIGQIGLQAGVSMAPEAQESVTPIGQIDLQAGASPEAQESVTPIGQIDLQEGILESGLRDLPSNGPQDLSSRLFPPPLQGPMDDDLTAWGEGPVQGLSFTPDATPTQKSAEPDIQNGVSPPLALFLSPSGSGPGAGQASDEEENPSGDGMGPASAPETRTTATVKEGRRGPALSTVAPALISPPVEHPGQWHATAEPGRTEEETGAFVPEAESTEPGSSKGLAVNPRPARTWPSEEEAGPVARGLNRPGRREGAEENPGPNVRDESAGSGDILGETGPLGLDPVERETARSGQTDEEKTPGRSAETSSKPGDPARKEAEPLSARAPSMNQDATLSLRMQSPPTAPDSGEHVETPSPAMSGMRRPEARNAPLPASEMPAFEPAPKKERAPETGPTGVDRSAESTGMKRGERSDRAGESAVETFRGEEGLEAATFRGERAEKGVSARMEPPETESTFETETLLTARGDQGLSAAPAQGIPDEKVENPSGPAVVTVTARKSPSDGQKMSNGSAAGQSFRPIPDAPSGMESIRVKTSDRKADDPPPTATLPLETQDRTAEPGGRSIRGEESRFDKQVERPGKPTRTLSVERPERRDPSRGSSDPVTASPQAEIAATSEGHVGKSDRRDTPGGERREAENVINSLLQAGDSTPLKPSPEYGPSPSSQHQHAASAAGLAPEAAGRTYTEIASHLAPPAIPNDPVVPDAVVRQVIRGAHFLLKDDVSEVHVRLEPPELGSVHIRLVSGGDTLSGEIGVSSHEVKGIVESHLHQLRSSLVEQGLHVGQIDVSVRDDQRGGAWPDRTGGFGRPGDTPDGRRNPERNGNPGWETREEDRRPRRNQNLVDYFA